MVSAWMNKQTSYLSFEHNVILEEDDSDVDVSNTQDAIEHDNDIESLRIEDSIASPTMCFVRKRTSISHKRHNRSKLTNS